MTSPAPFGRPDEHTEALLAARRAVDDADAFDTVVVWARGVLGTLSIALSAAERSGDAVELQNVLHDVGESTGEVSRELAAALGWSAS